MPVAESNHHQSTLKNWKTSSELNRLRLAGTAEYNLHGRYSVRMEGSSKWVNCEFPPVYGAAEWIFVNIKGMPVFYWDKNKNAIMLIG